MNLGRVLAGLLLAFSAGCGFTYADIEPDVGFDRAAIAFLDGLQVASIRENREYCGYFGLDASGQFSATEPLVGGPDSCELPRSASGLAIVASYHTHAAFDLDTDGEVPSSNDIRGDVEHGTFGYVSTPGGRVWRVDWRSATARQLCGVGCVTSDPAFLSVEAGPVAGFYTLSDMLRREAG